MIILGGIRLEVTWLGKYKRLREVNELMFMYPCTYVKIRFNISSRAYELMFPIASNTKAIDTNIYKGAELYARKHNLSVREFIERAILKAVNQKPSFQIKSEEELSPIVRELIGIAKSPDVDEDLDGKNALFRK